MVDATYDKGEHIKEAYAYFGRAYYMANVFEEGLSLAILQLEFLQEQLELIKRDGRDRFDQDQYELEFDKFIAKQNAQTLGNLIKRIHILVDLDEIFRVEIEKAKLKRDFLAHHFFRERAEDFVTRAGRDRMIAELDEAHQIFADADQHLSDFMGPFMSRAGIKNDKFHKSFDEFVAKHMADIEDRVE